MTTNIITVMGDVKTRLVIGCDDQAEYMNAWLRGEGYVTTMEKGDGTFHDRDIAEITRSKELVAQYFAALHEGKQT